jgi:hypothetical protein
MEQWQYCVIRMGSPDRHDFAIDQKQLQHLGDQGWELVNVVPIEAKGKGLSSVGFAGFLKPCVYDFIFKRRKTP